MGEETIYFMAYKLPLIDQVKKLKIMKKIVLIAGMILLPTVSVFSQDEPAVVKSLVSGYFIPLKFSYELGIGRDYTAGLSAGVTGISRYENDEFRFSLVPVLRTDLKHYYNLQKRYEKGKNTAMNSGNFWGIMARYTFEPVGGDIEKDPEGWGAVFFAPMWGIQRNYKSHISLGLNLGYGVGISRNDVSLNPLVGFQIGFVFFSSQ
jgi:hypothetical protein